MDSYYFDPLKQTRKKKNPSSILFLSSELVSRMLTVVNEYEVVQSGGWVKPTLRWTWLQWPLGLSPALVIHWKELTINLMVSKPWPQSVKMTWHRVDRRISGFKTESSLTCTLYCCTVLNLALNEGRKVVFRSGLEYRLNLFRSICSISILNCFVSKPTPKCFTFL